MTTRTQPSDRLSRTHQQLTAAIEQLVAGADWQEMLDVARRFHTYSTNNVLLILSQRPGRHPGGRVSDLAHSRTPGEVRGERDRHPRSPGEPDQAPRRP